jgi:hypothetical protein
VKLRFKGIISTSIAISIGVIILLGALLPFGQLAAIRVVLLQWALILAAVALGVGVLTCCACITPAFLRAKKGRCTAPC